MVITNSDTAPPPCCRKTRYSSDYIARTILAGNIIPRDLPAGLWRTKHSPPVHFPAWNNAAGNGPAVDYVESQNDWYRAWNNLWILSYKNIDVGGSGHWDHVYQAKVVLPLVIEKIVVPRWNASSGGTTLVGV